MKTQKKKQSEFRAVQQKALRSLEELGGKQFRDEKVIFEGEKLVIPKNMTITDAISYLNRKQTEENQITNFARSYKYRPWDVAYCCYHAMIRYFGSFTSTPSSVQTMFGTSEEAPQLITIPTGPGVAESVPWGSFRIPFVPNVTFTLDGTSSQEGPIGLLMAEGPRKMESAIEGVFALVEMELLENSLYRGKAFDAQPSPNFLDLSSLDPSKIVYSNDTMAQLEANLWSPILYRQETADLGIAFKRAVLLTGDFGVGKTLAINRTGQIATAQGITFILVRPGRDDIQQAVNIAKMYQPAIVAFEDVDVIANPDQSDTSISQVLDLFDGIEAKNSQVMLVLTSNHAERLHKGMLRPGRLDAVIPIGTPDHNGIIKLITNTIPEDQLEEHINWAEVAETMEEYLPAFIVEVAQRSLRYALVRNDGILNGSRITSEDLIQSARGLRPHFDLMNDASETKSGVGLERALIDTIHKATIEGGGQTQEPGEPLIEAVHRVYGVE